MLIFLSYQSLVCRVVGGPTEPYTSNLAHVRVVSDRCFKTLNRDRSKRRYRASLYRIIHAQGFVMAPGDALRQ